MAVPFCDLWWLHDGMALICLDKHSNKCPMWCPVLLCYVVTCDRCSMVCNLWWQLHHCVPFKKSTVVSFWMAVPRYVPSHGNLHQFTLDLVLALETKIAQYRRLTPCQPTGSRMNMTIDHFKVHMLLTGMYQFCDIIPLIIWLKLWVFCKQSILICLEFCLLMYYVCDFTSFAFWMYQCIGFLECIIIKKFVYDFM